MKEKRKILSYIKSDKKKEKKEQIRISNKNKKKRTNTILTTLNSIGAINHILLKKTLQKISRPTFNNPIKILPHPPVQKYGEKMSIKKFFSLLSYYMSSYPHWWTEEEIKTFKQLIIQQNQLIYIDIDLEVLRNLKNDIILGIVSQSDRFNSSLSSLLEINDYNKFEPIEFYYDKKEYRIDLNFIKTIMDTNAVIECFQKCLRTQSVIKTKEEIKDFID